MPTIPPLNNFSPPPTRILSWMQEVLYSDPDWNKEYTRPVIYEFSNGRIFRKDPDVYTD